MVTDDVRARALQALGTVLGPVIRLLLRTGVTWRDFSELGKAMFVKLATEEFGLRGRPTNIARVAMLTGLDRREVARLRRTQHEAEPAPTSFVSKPSLVLDGWHHDDDFRDSRGLPRDLEVDGTPDSFTELVRRYAPGLPVVAMIKELRGAGAVQETKSGRLRAIKRNYIPADFSANQLRLWASDLEALGTTIEHNLRRRPGDPARFQRRAINPGVDPKARAAFHEFMEAEAQAFLIRVDDWLSAHAAPGDDGIRLGAGVFHIEDRARQAQRRRHG